MQAWVLLLDFVVAALLLGAVWMAWGALVYYLIHSRRFETKPGGWLFIIPLMTMPVACYFLRFLPVGVSGVILSLFTLAGLYCMYRTYGHDIQCVIKDRGLRSVAGPLLVWLALIYLLFVDIPWNGGLYLSVQLFDYAKHIAVTDALTRDWVSPQNPFFSPEKPVALYYYYGWHLMAAMFQKFTGGWLDTRAVLMAGVFWTGVALVALLREWMRVLYGNLPPLVWLWILPGLLALSGLDFIFTAIGNVWHMVQQPNPPVPFLRSVETWNLNQIVCSWWDSVLWVPQHVGGAAAGLGALLLLVHHRQPAIKTGQMISAGIGLASSMLLSVWVGAVIGLAAVVWLVWCGWKRRDFHPVFGALVIAAFLLWPFVHELAASSPQSSSSVAWQIRQFALTEKLSEPWRSGLNLLLLPINYFFELGILLVAPFLFWKSARRNSAVLRPVELLLRVIFWSSMAASSLLYSTLRHNDLGWRGLLPAQFALLLWTIPVLYALYPRWRILAQAAPLRLPGTRFLKVLVVIGCLAVPLDLFLLRFTYMLAETPRVYLKREEGPGLALKDDGTIGPRVMEYAEGYRWLVAHSNSRARILSNPLRDSEIMYPLYAHRQAVAMDCYHGTLLAVTEARYSRVAWNLSPVFSVKPMPWERVLEKLAPYAVDFVVISDDDSGWMSDTLRANEGWPEPVFSNDAMKIFRVVEK